jgi:hypothetical protein
VVSAKISIKVSIVLFIVAFLSSCGSYIPILSTDTELNLGRNQHWSISYVVVLPGELRPLLGQYQTTLNQMVAEVQLKGVQASWELLSQEQNDPNISYKMKFQGTGYDQLNQVMFDGASAVTIDPSDEGRVQFQYSPQFSRFAHGQHNKFTLKCSEILSSNGVPINKGSVQWVDPPGEMNAIVSTATDLTWLWIALLGLGGTGFIVAGLGVRGRLSRRQKRATAPVTVYSTVTSPVQLNIKYCPQCGSQNPAEAAFCNHCGTRLP